VRAGAFGRELAIALEMYVPERHVRVLRIDTAKL